MASRMDIATLIGLLDGNVRRGYRLVSIDLERVNHRWNHLLPHGTLLDAGITVLDTNAIQMRPEPTIQYRDYLSSLARTTYLQDNDPVKLASNNVDWAAAKANRFDQHGRHLRIPKNSHFVDPAWNHRLLPSPYFQYAMCELIPNEPTTILIAHDTNLEARVLGSLYHYGGYIWYDTQLADKSEFGRGRRKLSVLCSIWGVNTLAHNFHNSGYDAEYTMRLTLHQVFHWATNNPQLVRQLAAVGRAQAQHYAQIQEQTWGSTQAVELEGEDDDEAGGGQGPSSAS